MSLSIPIIYEDKDCLVINKPAGLIVHPDGKTTEESVTSWVLENFPSLKDVGEPLILSSGETIPRPGIVHRLDRETSGALLIAKTDKAFASLKKQFQKRNIEKEYHAFVYGNISQDFGTIDRPIGRSRSDFRQWSAQRGTRGELRPAITRYEVKKRGEDATLVAAQPLTGRTHQIRVHFKAINHPVVSDSLYAPKMPSLLGMDRLALHAYSIGWRSLEGEMRVVTAPYPQDFEGAIQEINRN